MLRGLGVHCSGFGPPEGTRDITLTGNHKANTPS